MKYPTYFFEPPFQTPAGSLMYGGAIDHVFVRGSDIEDDHVRLLSATVPSITSDEFCKFLPQSFGSKHFHVNHVNFMGQ